MIPTFLPACRQTDKYTVRTRYTGQNNVSWGNEKMPKINREIEENIDVA